MHLPPLVIKSKDFNTHGLSTYLTLFPCVIHEWVLYIYEIIFYQISFQTKLYSDKICILSCRITMDIFSCKKIYLSIGIKQAISLLILDTTVGCVWWYRSSSKSVAITESNESKYDHTDQRTTHDCRYYVFKLAVFRILKWNWRSGRNGKFGNLKYYKIMYQHSTVGTLTK